MRSAPPYKVRRPVATDQDLATIADFLIDAYVAFGEPVDAAFERAEVRLAAIEDLMLTLAENPSVPVRAMTSCPASGR